MKTHFYFVLCTVDKFPRWWIFQEVRPTKQTSYALILGRAFASSQKINLVATWSWIFYPSPSHIFERVLLVSMSILHKNCLWRYAAVLESEWLWWLNGSFQLLECGAENTPVFGPDRSIYGSLYIAFMVKCISAMVTVTENQTFPIILYGKSTSSMMCWGYRQDRFNGFSILLITCQAHDWL